MKFLLVAAVSVAVITCSEAACSYHARQRRSAGLSHTPVHRHRRDVSCDSSYPYRSYDGTCNNLINTEWGAAGSQFLRLLDPVYDDNVTTPRQKASNGGDLPNPRTISNIVHFELSFTSLQNSPMAMQWGQFIDHDITKTPNIEDENGDEIDCCNRTDSVLTDSTSPCFPIHVPDGDEYYNNGTCLNLVRSEAVSGTSQRQQYNALSAFIDGSMIYGISEDEMWTLRDNSTGKGQLAVKNGWFLPEGNQSSCFYNSSEPENYCFLAGDGRVNVFFGLGAMHTLFLREHNRLAKALSEVNTGWDDEKLFQEARRIVIAELQIITFRDWLPDVLGDTAITNYGLGEGNYQYNDSLNPTFSNIFSGAAFRFGHSQVPEDFTIGGVTKDTGDLFFVTKYVIDSFDDVIVSLIEDAAERADAWYVDGMRNRMFESDSSLKDGTDIVARNIQRGREHGLPPYNDWRAYCGFDRITEFSNDDFGIIQGRNLSAVYSSVDDIDIYSGAISEKPTVGAIVGKTYGCLIAEQMVKLRDGDRFWYETDDTDVGFTQEQKDELDKISLGKIICLNSNLTQIQRNVFRFGSTKQSCDNLRYPDLDEWKEE